ncbi:ABC-2 type transport system permease protein [Mycoplana sp. BE70]|uniref:ABC transporter permease n=1 Tax=Mycoplana sp. BE70 TaxID=2817775 RepID=UPI00285A1AC2|nr:ABC transporter permease [Mycoplana sp. BE70]MDR6759169.1 ABC-2 type transport system permease protein [Mycoplana sp. BE70]
MLASLLRIVTLIRKELLVILKDPKSRASLVLPPILQCLIFGYAATYDLNTVPYALIDLDRSATSRELISKLEGSGIFQRQATLAQTGQAVTLLDTKKVILVIVVERDFERQLASGSSSAVQVIADGRNSNTSGVAQGYANTIIADFAADWRSRKGISGPAVQVTTRAWFNPQLETRWTMIPSLIGTITMMMTMMLTAMSVAREREEGTFEQLLVAPFTPTEIMVGKAVPSMIVGIAQSSAILMVALFWFQIPFAGSLLTLYLGLALFLAAAIGFGLFLSSLAANMQQAMILCFMFLMPFMLLSGLMSPTDNMPEVLQYVTMINPLKYAISITRRVYLEGAHLTELLPDMLALVVIAAVTMPISAWMFRHRLN